MMLNMATTCKKGLLFLGLATAIFANSVMGIGQNNANSLNSSDGAPSNKSFLKGVSNKKQQQVRRTASVKKGGLAYSIDFSAADPDLYTLENPVPYPINYPPAKLIAGRGNAEDKNIPKAMFNDGSSTGGNAMVKVESLMPEDLYLGQIVPFELLISVSGLDVPSEDGKIQITAGWSTITTSGGAFGYDFQNYGVYAAFIDVKDGAHYDPKENARVTSYTWSYVNNDEIQGVFNVEGLDDGDEVVLEVWVVIQDSFPSAGATGNVHSRLIDAKTATTQDAINTGTQTVPMMQMNKGSPSNDIQSRLGTTSVAANDLLCL